MVLMSMPDDQIIKHMQPFIDEVKADVAKAAAEGAEDFYGAAPQGTYTRTGSFSSMGQKEPQIKRSADKLGVDLTFTFSSDEVSVNPWGGYSGSPEESFNADYLNGFHGGPRKVQGGGYSWQPVPKSDSPFDHIVEVLQGKYEVMIDG